MTFVTPWLAALAAAITVPVLLLLYFLKLRRSPVRIPSTLLWRKSFEDLQVNTPFQRIRWSWLLLIQGLLLAALVLAMAQPRGGGGDSGSNRLIVLVDRSASMNATDGRPDGTSRLDAAKQAARDLVDRIGRGGSSKQMMIIAFGATASVRTGFETRRQVLRAAIDSIVPTDETADLEAALELAGAFASRREDAAEAPPDVVLISDGVLGPPPRAGGFSLRAGEFTFTRVEPEEPGAATVNVGITTLSARRDLDDPSQVNVFARMIHTGRESRDVVASISIDGGEPMLGTRMIPGVKDDRPGEAEFRFSFASPAGGLIVLRHNARDALAADDVAAVVLPPPARPRVAVVTPDSTDEQNNPAADPYLLNLLEQMDLDRLSVMNTSRFGELNEVELDAGGMFDLVIFDRVSASRLPGVPSMTFGAVPGVIDVREPERAGGRRILSWDRQHPVMRHVSLDRVVYSDFGGMDLPAGGEALAYGPDGPVVAQFGTRGVRHMVVGFSLTNSNWPLDVSLLVFTQNALDQLLLGRTGETGLVFRPGDPITVRSRSDVMQLRVIGPDSEAIVNAEPGEATTLPAIRTTGVFEVQGAQPPHEQIVVSMLSESESDCRPRDEVTVNAARARAAGLERAAPYEWWPWLIGLALGLLMIEWMIYCLRVRSV